MSLRAGPVLLHLADQAEGGLDGWASGITSMLYPGKALFNGKLPGSPLHQGASPGQNSMGEVAATSQLQGVLLVTQSLKKC